VHTLDAARLYRLAVEHIPAGPRLHAVAQTGIPFRDIAEAIARKLGIAAASLTPESFSYLSPFFVALDNPVSSDLTQQLLSWQPTRPTLAEDIDKGFYFER
jgi:nucleoside-diphosphate-sugar epimerase